MVGWDEVLGPGRAEGHRHSVLARTGIRSRAAAKQGYRGILSNGYYLDLGWPAARHYAVDPLSGAAANLTAGGKEAHSRRRILHVGGIRQSRKYRFAHLAAQRGDRGALVVTAERHRSRFHVRAPGCRQRAAGVARSDAQDVLPPECCSESPDPRRRRNLPRCSTLADVVEPVKDYTREQTAPAEPTSATPLNRVVDAVPLESETARHFGELVDQFLAASCHDAALGSALTRSAHRLARQRRKTSAARAAIVPGEGSLREFAGSLDAGSMTGSRRSIPSPRASARPTIGRRSNLPPLQQVKSRKRSSADACARRSETGGGCVAAGGACSASNVSTNDPAGKKST